MNKFRIILSAAANFLAGRSFDLTYISEGARWVISSIGQSLIERLNDLSLLKARMSITHQGVKSRLVHFGSIHAFLTTRRTNLLPTDIKTIVTWFHIEPNDEKVARLVKVQDVVAKIHTACSLTKNQLIAAGIDSLKIVQIPLGINLDRFEPKTTESTRKIRTELGISSEAIVIGSFQKDGVGWADGTEPKLIKGPDIFLKVIAQLLQANKIHVLLTGPGRGYLKKGLEELGCPYTHIPYVEDESLVAPYYHALDLYLVSSRIEGGPMSILESWASGVPLVATKVGMIPDIAQHDKHALLYASEDVAGLVEGCHRLIVDKNLGERLAVAGLAEVVCFDWSLIAKRYYEEIYKPLL